MKDEAGLKGRSGWAKRWGSGDAVEHPEVWAPLYPSQTCEPVAEEPECDLAPSTPG